MPYTATTIQQFGRRLAAVQYLFDNVLTPMKDTHELLTEVFRGIPHSEQEGLRDVVHNAQLPAGFVDLQPLADIPQSAQGSRISDGSFVATVSQRINDLAVWITVLDTLQRTDVVMDKHDAFAVAINDLVYANPRMGGNALTVEIVGEANTHRTLGDRIAMNWQLVVPVAWKVR